MFCHCRHSSQCVFGPSLGSEVLAAATPGSVMVVDLFELVWVLGYVEVLIGNLPMPDEKPCASLVAVLVILPTFYR